MYRHKSFAIICQNIECKVKYLYGQKNDKLLGAQFVCECTHVHLEDNYENGELSMEKINKCGKRIVCDATDNLNDMRATNCYGANCGIGFSDGLNVHCESCHGSLNIFKHILSKCCANCQNIFKSMDNPNQNSKQEIKKDINWQEYDNKDENEQDNDEGDENEEIQEEVKEEDDLDKDYLGGRLIACKSKFCSIHYMGECKLDRHMVVFACNCISNWSKQDLIELTDDEACDYNLTIVNKRRDTPYNIRTAKCHGMKCRVYYGCNINVHCESCFGHATNYM